MSHIASLLGISRNNADKYIHGSEPVGEAQVGAHTVASGSLE